MIPSTSARLVAALAGTLLLSGAAVQATDAGPDVTLELLGRVDGDEDGQATPADPPAPDQRMSVTNTRGETVCAGRTGSDAMLTCRLSPGRYTVTASPPAGSYLTAAASAHDSVSRTVQVTGPVGTSHQEVFGSSCLRDVAVRVHPVESDYHRMTATYAVSGDGREVSRDQVALVDQGLEWTGQLQDVARAGEVIDLHYGLVVEPGARVQTSAPLEIRVEPGGGCRISAEYGLGRQPITGSVLGDVDGDGAPSLVDRPLEGVTVALHRVTGGEELTGERTSNAFGEVGFVALEPGRYVGHVHPPTGWTVAPGSPEEIEVELFLDQRPEGELVFLLQEDDA